MKKINFKKIGILVLWIAVVSGIIVTLGFVNAEEKEVRGKSVAINISSENENEFIDEDDIRRFLKEKKDTLVNQPMKDINVFELEKALNAHPAVSKAEVSVDINGAVNIDLKQRQPIVRLITFTNESYYIDNEARLMPLSDNYTARVLVANGFIFEKYSMFYNTTVKKIMKDTTIEKITVIDDIYKVAEYIVKDTLLNNLIQQIYVNEDKELELYPVLGSHKIIFGKGEDIEEKFTKLKIFYREGLNSINNWNKYSSINLKYKDQVVCTKK